MRIVMLSDTHGLHDDLTVPDGDLLVHAGDLTLSGELGEIERFDAFLTTLPHRHKVVVAGNHDWAFQRAPSEARARITAAHYLEDEAVAIEGLVVYGSPWQPWFLDWAFNLPRGAPLRERWDRIPDDTDVLVTHGPPAGRGDRLLDGTRVGCEELAAAVARVAPRLHVFGHIHEDAGTSSDGRTLFVNASVCTVGYAPTQPVRVFDL